MSLDENILESIVPGDSLAKRAEARSLQNVKALEARRLLLKAIDAGITKDAVVASKEQFKQMIDDEFDRTSNVASPELSLAEHIFSNDFEWVQNGEIILIDGSDMFTRMLAGKICLYRAVLTAAGREENRLAAMVNFPELMVKLSMFHSSKFALLDNLKAIPFLFLYEVMRVHTVRESSDAAALLDTILVERIQRKKPIIMSFSAEIKEFGSVQLNFGSVFADFVVSAENKKYFPLVEKAGLVRMRLKEIS